MGGIAGQADQHVASLGVPERHRLALLVDREEIPLAYPWGEDGPAGSVLRVGRLLLPSLRHERLVLDIIRPLNPLDLIAQATQQPLTALLLDPLDLRAQATPQTLTALLHIQLHQHAS